MNGGRRFAFLSAYLSELHKDGDLARRGSVSKVNERRRDLSDHGRREGEGGEARRRKEDGGRRKRDEESRRREG